MAPNLEQDGLQCNDIYHIILLTSFHEGSSRFCGCLRLARAFQQEPWLLEGHAWLCGVTERGLIQDGEAQVIDWLVDPLLRHGWLVWCDPCLHHSIFEPSCMKGASN